MVATKTRSKSKTKKAASPKKRPKEAEPEVLIDGPEEEFEGESQELQIKILQNRVHLLEQQKRARAAGEELVVSAVRSVWEDNPPVYLYTMPPRPSIALDHKNEEIAVVLLSDIHYGKVTPTFNSAVCEERLMLLAEKIIHITNLRRNQATIRELHLLLGGDMLEGEDIFPHQAHLIDKNLLEQACRSGAAAYIRLIQRLLADFEEINIVCVPGNHGRNGPRHSRSHPLTNWDRVLYEILKMAFLGHDLFPRKELSNRVRLHHDDNFYAIDPVGDWNILVVHGDQIRGGHAGFPFYGVGKKAWGWGDALRDYDGVPEAWDYLCFGHFHTSAYGTLNLKEWFANGSIESHNTHAQENLASSGIPSQWLFYFDPEKGLINQNVVYLDSRYSDIMRAKLKTQKFRSKIGGKKRHPSKV
jgi:hypothetical protein